LLAADLDFESYIWKNDILEHHNAWEAGDERGEAPVKIMRKSD